MKFLPFIFLMFLWCCTYLPELAKTIDDIETDEAVSIHIDKEALKKDTDVRISVDILNKDTPALSQP